MENNEIPEKPVEPVVDEKQQKQQELEANKLIENRKKSTQTHMTKYDIREGMIRNFMEEIQEKLNKFQLVPMEYSSPIVVFQNDNPHIRYEIDITCSFADNHSDEIHTENESLKRHNTVVKLRKIEISP